MARPVMGARSIAVLPAPQPTRQLRAVSSAVGRRRRPKVFFATVTVISFFIIIVAQILLSISLQSGAYEIAGLQRDVKELGRTYQSATQDLNRMTSPQNVAQSAEVLGMVGNSNPVYLRLSDSLVTGAATATGAGGTLVAQGSLVPNAMLAEALAERQAAAKAAAETAIQQARTGGAGSQTGNVGPGSAPATLSPVVAVPSPQGLPSPATR
jgi:hypothetical protein